MTRMVVIVVAFALTFSQAEAQRPRANAGAQRQNAQGGDSQRAELESDIRRSFARAVRERVGLSEAQMQRLAPLAQRHEQARRQLQAEERDVRRDLLLSLRENSSGENAAALLDRMVDIQKRRAALFETEQRELAAIMTPVQRVRYIALQEQIRRRLEQLRQRRQGDGVAPRRPLQRPF